MVASETASSWGPQLNAQPPPPIAQAPNPVLVIITRLEPRGRCGRFILDPSVEDSTYHRGQALIVPLDTSMQCNCLDGRQVESASSDDEVKSDIDPIGM